MKLKEIIETINYRKMTGNPDIEIKGITSNSRQVGEGFLFCAVRGDNTDGHKYIASAVSNGANSVLLQDMPENKSKNITYIEVDNSMQATPLVAANFYNNPTKKITLIGITGTNGKTTTSYILDSIWKKNNLNSGIIGTIEISYNGVKRSSSMTTPDSIELTKILSEMSENNVNNVSMEVSSHALDRHRADGCHFDGAIFTNLTQDHLDYHGNLENYYNSKKKLFTDLLKSSDKTGKVAVINTDDEFGLKLVDEIECRVLTYSLKPESGDIYPSQYEISSSGIKAEIITPKGKVNLNSSLIGEHNLYNILSAIGIAIELNTPIEVIEDALSGNINVPGRLERVENDRGINVLVDYAHTPDALENVLNTITPLKKGRIITLFGCGGDRDKGKRPKMGKIAARFSDFTIITSDNPRTEDPEIILDEIEAGIKTKEADNTNYIKISDRKMAIEFALQKAKPGDIVLLAGKGHEDYQIIGNEKTDFDDKVVANNYFLKAEHYND